MNDFKGRHFGGEIVLWAVRWYCRYAVSYRDLEAMMTERGVAVDHSTIYRWIQRFVSLTSARAPGSLRRRRPSSCSVVGSIRADAHGKASQHDAETAERLREERRTRNVTDEGSAHAGNGAAHHEVRPGNLGPAGKKPAGRGREVRHRSGRRGA